MQRVRLPRQPQRYELLLLHQTAAALGDLAGPARQW